MSELTTAPRQDHRAGGAVERRRVERAGPPDRRRRPRRRCSSAPMPRRWTSPSAPDGWCTGSRVDLLTNQLVVVGAPGLDAAGGRAGGARRRRPCGASPSAIPTACRPASTPGSGWRRPARGRPLPGKVVPTVTVRAALAAVRSGRADAGRGLPHRRRAPSRRCRCSTPCRSPTRRRSRYPAAVVEGPHQAAAQRFLDYLRGAEAGAVFTAAGFGLAGR